MPHRDIRIRYDRIAITLALIAGLVSTGAFYSAQHHAKTAQPPVPAPTLEQAPQTTKAISEQVYVPADAIFEIDFDDTLLRSWQQVAEQVQAEKEAAARAERERARREREERERLETERRESAARDKQRPKKTPPGDEQPKAKTPSKGDIKAYASDLVGGGEQFKCLDKLWERESNWNHTATNPTSGAYGIPQAYPGDKMASAGKDWRTNPRTQVRWGVSYIEGRYGTPCGAWDHSQRKGWY